MSKAVGFVTSAAFPRLTPDDRLAAAALEAAGLLAQPVRWDDADADWGAFATLVIRSTWDYHLRPDEFRAWLDSLEAVGTPIWNPVGVLRWNMDKRYLQDLEADGVALTPSVWLPRGAKVDLADLLERKGWSQAVVKPTISASAHQTQLINGSDAGGKQPDFSRMLASGSLLVQPFMPEVRSKGEWSLLFFDKQFSHAVLKHAAEDDFRVQLQFGGRQQAATPPDALLAQAAAILDLVDGPLLHARVDGVERDGHFILMELELIEPVLFFEYAQGAPERFAQTVLDYLKVQEAA